MLTAQDLKKISAIVATKKDIGKLDKRLSDFETNTEKRSASLEKKIGSLDTRVSGVEISMFRLQEEASKTNLHLDSFEEKFDRQLVLIDRLIERVEAMRLEYAAVANQLSRHEEWIKQIAQKAGVKLEF